jgi:3'(2'), 5'-bisphosphate nucleotidase
MDRAAWFRSVIALAQQAGVEIARIYTDESAWVRHKEDGSPLTAADMAAHRLIAAGLAQLTPDVPLLSEEDAPPAWEIRRHWPRYWLVDPLDGTREFVGRTGEFTINIALIEHNQPVLGVVVAPMLHLTWAALDGVGALRLDGVGGESPIRTRAPASPLVLVTSRRHRQGREAKFAARLEAACGEVVRVDMGSSLKMCRIAEGSADLYPRFGPTCEWDTAAADAILRAAGGALLRADGEPLSYNKPDLLNPDFVALGAPDEWPRFRKCWLSE